MSLQPLVPRRRALRQESLHPLRVFHVVDLQHAAMIAQQLVRHLDLVVALVREVVHQLFAVEAGHLADQFVDE